MTCSYNYFSTTQRGPSPHLEKIVKLHAHTAYRKPIAKHQIQAFAKIIEFINQHQKPIILDSGCGTGMSTYLLAERFNNHVVIGIDKSCARLSRNKKLRPSNALLIRADLLDLWRLLSEHKLLITHHFMFFPNPWPKATQIKRRFHAHPVFSTMAGLADYFELRTNWQIYAEECALAFKLLGHSTHIDEKNDSEAMTLFEKKYLEALCPIYILKSHRFVPNTSY